MAQVVGAVRAARQAKDEATRMLAQLGAEMPAQSEWEVLVDPLAGNCHSPVSHSPVSHSLALPCTVPCTVLVAVMEAKELKTKISLTHSLIHSLALSLTLPCSLVSDSKVTLYTHTHTLTITCTCCYDEIKGIQDLKIYSHAVSLVLSHSPVSLILTLPCTVSP